MTAFFAHGYNAEFFHADTYPDDFWMPQSPGVGTLSGRDSPAHFVGPSTEVDFSEDPYGEIFQFSHRPPTPPVQKLALLLEGWNQSGNSYEYFDDFAAKLLSTSQSPEVRKKVVRHLASDSPDWKLALRDADLATRDLAAAEFLKRYNGSKKELRFLKDLLTQGGSMEDVLARNKEQAQSESEWIEILDNLRLIQIPVLKKFGEDYLAYLKVRLAIQTVEQGAHLGSRLEAPAACRMGE
jgi:hypothetical protein